jgi:outer membrane lipoprotein SlyB
MNMTKENTIRADKQKGTDANRDPITGTPGAHPVGTGVGAAGGAATGAAIGAVAGPVGAAVGLVAGAVAGGLAGKGVAEKIDPTVEDAYWKTNYSKRSYVAPIG